MRKLFFVIGVILFLVSATCLLFAPNRWCASGLFLGVILMGVLYSPRVQKTRSMSTRQAVLLAPALMLALGIVICVFLAVGFLHYGSLLMQRVQLAEMSQETATELGITRE
jgi:predicted membrane protein